MKSSIYGTYIILTIAIITMATSKKPFLRPPVTCWNATVLADYLCANAPKKWASAMQLPKTILAI